MPILKSIKEAEERIEELRIETQKKVDKMLKKAKNEGDKKVKQLFVNAEETTRVSDAETQTIIIAKGKEIVDKYNSGDLDMIKKAKSNHIKATDFVVKKVLKS